MAGSRAYSQRENGRLQGVLVRMEKGIHYILIAHDVTAGVFPCGEKCMAYLASFPGRFGTHCTGACAHAYNYFPRFWGIRLSQLNSSKSTSVNYSYSSAFNGLQPFSAVDPPLVTSYCKFYKMYRERPSPATRGRSLILLSQFGKLASVEKIARLLSVHGMRCAGPRLFQSMYYVRLFDAGQGRSN